MTIARDMDPPLTALSRLRASLAMDPACRAHVELLGACLITLEECRERVMAAERCAVPEHWLPQRSMTWDDARAGKVVSLMAARHARDVARRAAL